jgi:DNA-binding CsgD family transcriptional regulator
MGLDLSTDDQARLSAATAALLSSSVATDLEAWVGEALDAVRFLFRGDNGSLAVPGPDGLVLATEGLPVETVTAMRDQVVGLEPGVLRMRDPDLDRVSRLRERAGLEVYTHSTLERAAGPWLVEAGFRRELTRPAGMDHFVGLRVPLAVGEAILSVGYARAPARFDEDERLQLAGLLLPAFRSGVRAGVRMRPGRSDSALDGSRLLPTGRDLCRRHGLTPREAEIALLLARGASDREVAAALSISHHTVRKHAEHIFAKLGLHTRKALALRLMEL